jgi:hypothetical protein
MQYCNIYKIHTSGMGNILKMKGNIITYPQEPNQLLNLLPEIPASDMIQIIFIGTVKPAYIDLNKIFNVRREKIKITLEWLIKNNHLYKTVKISDENLSKFPQMVYRI